MDDNVNFDMDPGASLSSPASPVASLVGGPHPYLWVGETSGVCYATLDGAKLRKLAEVILAELDKPTPKRKRRAKP